MIKKLECDTTVRKLESPNIVMVVSSIYNKASISRTLEGVSRYLQEQGRYMIYFQDTKVLSQPGREKKICASQCKNGYGFYVTGKSRNPSKKDEKETSRVNSQLPKAS